MGTVESPHGAPSPAGDSRVQQWAAFVVIVVLGITALKIGRPVVLPVVIALLCSLLLSAPVRWLRRRRIPERVGAAIMVFGALGIAFGVTGFLVTPATEWVASAPATLAKVERKVRHFARPIAALQQSADRMATAAAPDLPAGKAPAQVQIAAPSLLERVSEQMLGALPATLSVVFLTYFLLASGPLFRRKLAQILPGRRDVVHFEKIIGEIELVTSRFLAAATMINTGVGVATWLALWAVGGPNPLLWGGVAAVLNYIPYLGPITTASVIALASLAKFDSPARALVAPACFIAIHLVENNLVTPVFLGRRLPVNTVAIFIGLIFFSWVWGIPGAVLAVPLTTVVKVACDHVPPLHHFGELLGN